MTEVRTDRTINREKTTINKSLQQQSKHIFIACRKTVYLFIPLVFFMITMFSSWGRFRVVAKKSCFVIEAIHLAASLNKQEPLLANFHGRGYSEKCILWIYVVICGSGILWTFCKDEKLRRIWQEKRPISDRIHPRIYYQDARFIIQLLENF